MRPEYTCEKCGKLFRLQRRDKRKFCSFECYRQHKIVPRPAIACFRCKKVITRRNIQVFKSKTAHKYYRAFCSVLCAAEYRKEQNNKRKCIRCGRGYTEVRKRGFIKGRCELCYHKLVNNHSEQIIELQDLERELRKLISKTLEEGD